MITAGILISCSDKKDNATFPQSTTFKQILSSENIVKISIKNGNNGETRETIDKQKSNSFINKIENEKLYRNDNSQPRGGFVYSVNFYYKDKTGFYTYTLGYGFSKSEDFVQTMPTGYCKAENENRIKDIVSEFYEKLK